MPKSFAEAMANNEVLQILVFSLFFGTAIASLRRDGAPTMDSASHGQRGSLKEKTDTLDSL